MRAVVVGAGPVGMFCGIALARQGYEVVLVDRDPGPPTAGAWRRRGVMQFTHPHFFRPMVRQALQDLMPDVWDALLAAGGVPALPEGMPPQMTGLACRRSTFETALRGTVAREPGLTLRVGHADAVVAARGRAAGVVVDARPVAADLVLCAAGRLGRFADDMRRPAEGGACGFSYVSRMYRARPGVEAPTGFPMGSLYPGYLAIVFPQDDSTLSALVVRPSGDDALAGLRHADQFNRMASLVPSLARWTDPDGFEPLTDPLPGGGLTNTYRSQLDEQGGVPLPGLLFVGDAVSTTNPAAGRGVSLGLRQAKALLGLLADAGTDLRDATEALDCWSEQNIRPWYEDHVYWDETLGRRMAGEDIDVEGRLPSDVICAAAAVDPGIGAAAGAYLGMVSLPEVLDAVAERARAVLRTGWRPPYAEGPSRDVLVAALTPVAA